MAFLGYLEVAIHLHSFRNIDLYHQGAYSIRAHVYREFGRTANGIPTSVAGVPNAHSHRNGIVDTASNAFSTNDYQIRYCDEEIDLNAYCLFVIPVKLTDAAHYTAPVIIEFDLFFAETDELKGQAKKEGENAEGKHSGEDWVEKGTDKAECTPQTAAGEESGQDRSNDKEDGGGRYHEASYQIFRILNPLNGVAEYFNATFDHLHLSILNCTTYCTFTQISASKPDALSVVPPRLPMRLHQQRPSATLNYTSKESAIKTRLTSASAVTPDFEVAGESFASFLGKVVDALDLPIFDANAMVLPVAELSASRSLSSSIGSRSVTDMGVLLKARADAVYKVFLTMLLKSYFRTRAFFHTLKARCLSSHEADELSDLLRLSQYLTLPGHLRVRLNSKGLPEPTTRAAGKGTTCFTIPACLCADAALDLLVPEGADSAVAGATRTIEVDYLPPSARLGRQAPRAAPLTNIFVSDMELLWAQIDEVWEKLQALLCYSGRQAEFYLRFLWESRLSARCREYVFLELHKKGGYATLPTSRLLGSAIAYQTSDHNLGQIHQDISTRLRAHRERHRLPPMDVSDPVQDALDVNYPILFEERHVVMEMGELGRELGSASTAYASVEIEDISAGHWSLLSELRGGLQEVMPRSTPSPEPAGLRRARSLAAGDRSPNHSAEFRSMRLLDIQRSSGDNGVQRGWDKGIISLQCEYPGLSLRPGNSAGENGMLSGLFASSSEELSSVADERFSPHETTALTFESVFSNPEQIKISASLKPSFHRARKAQTRCASASQPTQRAQKMMWKDRNFIDPGPFFTSLPSIPKPYKGLHLVVLVHGFLGSTADLRLVRNQLIMLFPEAIYLLCSSNESKTDGDITEMGQRLAGEIVSFIETSMNPDLLCRISFIAHSLGGIISRQALQYIPEKYLQRLHLFLSLSSPHLGYVFAKNKLVDAGLWVLKKWRKSNCLAQLSMTDAKDPRKTFLYKLAESPNLGRFRHFVLMSCYQDQYIPFESSRIEMGAKVSRDPLWSQVHQEMGYNILSQIGPQALTRLDVNFQISERGINTYIGRAAHIHFIASPHLVEILAFTYPHWFA